MLAADPKAGALDPKRLGVELGVDPNLKAINVDLFLA